MDTVGLQDIQTLARQESARLRHYFIGVEHLFIALTQLKGGLTTAVLEHHNISARFVRYSIRETIGRYDEERRYWPGFPETPRALHVLNLAKRYAGIHPPSERDLLLAILDESDSVVTRVLQEVGANIAELRRTAANWTSPLRTQAPEVPIEGDVELDAEQRRVLQLMFRDYGRIRIVRSLDGGHSGAKVLLVRPIRVESLQDAPVVVKLDDRHSVLYERRRYDLYVKGTLPAATARLVDSPVVPDNSPVGGLKYTFVGGVQDTEPVSVREFAKRHGPKELGTMIQTLFDMFAPSWWMQRSPYRFFVWREYEHVLPPALIVDVLPGKNIETGGHDLSPLKSWSRAAVVLPGEQVALTGFTVQKVDTEKGVLHLAAGAQPEAVNRSGKVEVRGLGDEIKDYYRGEVVNRMVGRVAQTRDDLLLRTLNELEPDFDIRSDSIPSQSEWVQDLPNPLHYVNKLLNRQITGHLSMIHGDMHLGNILVGPHGDPWLIDFAWAREGHTLFDWVMLEASLLVEIIAHLAEPGWAGAWHITGLLSQVNHGKLEDVSHPAAQAMEAVITLRDVAQQCLGTADWWEEYYVALSLLSLRLMDWKSEGIDARRVAFLVSALALSEAQSRMTTDDKAPWADIATDLDRTDIRIDD
jgi:hypothetical protein